MFCYLCPRTVPLHGRSLTLAVLCRRSFTRKFRGLRGPSSERIRRRSRGTPADCGLCRSLRPVPTPANRGRAETCGRATQRSWCPRNPAALPPASPWSPDPGGWSVGGVLGGLVGCVVVVVWCGAVFWCG